MVGRRTRTALCLTEPVCPRRRFGRMTGSRGEIAGAVYVKLWPLNASEAFSLTPLLSRWEREQPLDNFVKFERSQAAVRARFAKTRGTFLPLRVGGVGGADGEEGRDEVSVQPTTSSRD